MTDTQMIFKFIDRNYTLSIIDSGFILIENTTKEHYFYNSFIVLLRKIFGDFIGPEGTVYDIFVKWLADRKMTLVKKLHDYLCECEVFMSMSNWRVRHKKTGENVTVKDLHKVFGGEYTVNFIQYYYNQWLADEISNRTERIMRTF